MTLRSRRNLLLIVILAAVLASLSLAALGYGSAVGVTIVALLLAVAAFPLLRVTLRTLRILLWIVPWPWRTPGPRALQALHRPSRALIVGIWVGALVVEAAYLIHRH